MKNHSILVEYEEILMKKRKVFSKSFVGQNTQEKEIIPAFRYAFSLLGWSVRDVRDYVTVDILKFMKLYRLYRHIRHPGEIDPQKDMFYLAYKIYPEKLKYSKRDTVTNTYEKVLQGLRKKLPKNFFEGADGEMNCIICMQHLISKNNFASLDDLYKFFANKEEAEKFIRDGKLDTYYKASYAYPIDFLQDVLPDEVKDELLYEYYKFNSEYERVKKEGETVED